MNEPILSRMVEFLHSRIPSKEVADEFEWPLVMSTSGCDSDFSKYPSLTYRASSCRGEGTRLLESLDGAFLVSAIEALTEMLYAQKRWLDE